MSDSNDLELQVAAKAVIVNDKGEALLVRESKTGVNNTKLCIAEPKLLM